MSNGWIVLAVVACLAVTMDIKKGSVINRPLLEEYFPSDLEVYEYDKTIASNNNDLS